MLPLPIPELILILVLGTASGVMIGCIGIGGVILVPALVFLLSIPIEVAIPAAMLSYILSGAIATTVFARNKSISWGMATWLCVGATPAAAVGAWAVSWFNPLVLEVVLGSLTLLSGLNSLRSQSAPAETGKVSNGALIGVGTFTGFLSALTGTGGPLVLVPILISLNVPLLTAVGLSQAIQLPVAVAATIGNMLYGKLDWTLGALLAAGLTLGSWCGAKLAHAAPRSVLRAIVCVVLVLVGAFILGNVGLRIFR